MATTEDALGWIQRLSEFQEAHRLPVTNIAKQAPAVALHSLRDAAALAPANYRAYLDEAIDCYENGAYRGAVLMVWAATVEHVYSTIERKQSGFKTLEKHNAARFGQSGAYKKIRKKDDLLYLSDQNFFLICEDAGVFNKNARALLTERLTLRNRCGHPTGYVVGREEAVVFIESLLLNIVNDGMMNWK